MEDSEKEKLFTKFMEAGLAEYEENKSNREKFMKDNPNMFKESQQQYVRLDLRIPVSVAYKILKVLENES